MGAFDPTKTPRSQGGGFLLGSFLCKTLTMSPDRCRNKALPKPSIQNSQYPNASVRQPIRFFAICNLVALALAVSSARAQSLVGHPESVWVSPGFYSYHFKRDNGLRDSNPGLGLTLRYSESSAIVLGRFRNSDDAMSTYLGYLYLPYRLGTMRLGVALAAFDGYPEMQDGKAFLSVIPTLGFPGKRFALNVGIIPEIKDRVHGAVSLQFLVRFGP